MIRKVKVGYLGGSEKSGKVEKFAKCDKLIVALAIVVATGLCTTQLCDIVQRFFERPVANCVKIVKSNTFKIPAFVVCPRYGDDKVNEDPRGQADEYEDIMPNIVQKLAANKNKGDEPGNTSDSNSDDLDSFLDEFYAPLEDLWSKSQIKVELGCNACRIAVDPVKCMKGSTKGGSVLQLDWSKPTIFGGKCMIVTQTDALYYSQRSKGLKFNITTIDSGKRIAMQFVDNLQSVTYDMSFESTIVSSNSKLVIFNLRTFSYLNRKNSPCMPNDEARKCTERKIEDDLEKLKLCNLPMLDSRRHPKNCSTINDTASDVRKLAEWFLQEGVNRCARKCHEAIVAFREVQATETESDDRFAIYLANNVLEEISEEYAYGSSALLSDIAGNVGFYWGISLVHIICKPLLFLKNRFI